MTGLGKLGPRPLAGRAYGTETLQSLRAVEEEITDDVLARATRAVIDGDDVKQMHAYLQLLALEGVYPERG